MSKIKYFLEQSWLLIVAAVVFGALLAMTDAAWGPRIKQNQAAKFNKLAGGLLKDAVTFEPVNQEITIPLNGTVYPVDVKKGLDRHGNLVGWAFVCQGNGFADIIKLVVAVDAKFDKMEGFGVLSSNETPGFGDKITIPGGFFQKQFMGAPVTTLHLEKSGNPEVIDSQIVAISGATVSSTAVVRILNDFLLPVKKQLIEKGLLKQD